MGKWSLPAPLRTLELIDDGRRCQVRRVLNELACVAWWKN